MTATTILMKHTFREMTLRDANKAYAKVRAMIGLSETAGTWFTEPNANVKFTHTLERFTYGLSLMPAQSGRAFCLDNGFDAAAAALNKFNVCPHSTPMCREGCLATAGKGMFDNTKADLERAFASMAPFLAGRDLPAVDLSSEHYFDDVVFSRLVAGEGLPYPGGREIDQLAQQGNVMPTPAGPVGHA